MMVVIKHKYTGVENISLLLGLSLLVVRVADWWKGGGYEVYDVGYLTMLFIDPDWSISVLLRY